MIDDATSGDYDRLLATIAKHVEEPEAASDQDDRGHAGPPFPS